MHSTKVKKRLLPSLSPSIILRTGLLILLLAACAPAAVPPQPSGEQQPSAPVAVEPTATAFTPVDSAPADTATDVAAAPTEAVAPPLPVATSRGDNLEATNPSTVNLASGDLQFVEFFRFT